MNYIIKHQHPDGWIGPTDDRGGHVRDTWPSFIAMKALTQWADAMGDSRVEPVIEKGAEAHRAANRCQAIGIVGVVSLGRSAVEHQLALRSDGGGLVAEVCGQSSRQGFDWGALFSENYPHREKTICKKGADGCTSTHGVNNAMGIKTPGAVVSAFA